MRASNPKLHQNQYFCWWLSILASQTCLQRRIANVRIGPLAGRPRQFDGSGRAIALKRRDGAIAQENLVALALPDHEPDLGDQEVARLGVVVDFAGTLQVVEGDLNRILRQ